MQAMISLSNVARSFDKKDVSYGSSVYSSLRVPGTWYLVVPYTFLCSRLNMSQ